MSRATADDDAPRRIGDKASRRLALAVGTLCYAGIGVAMFANVLSLSVTRGTTCACSDSSLFAWFFEWPLVAISHGHNPFFSSQLFHPMGINLLSNTSVTAWTFLLLPITAVFGPFASLNVALIAAPALSGAAAMWVAQRWVRNPIAAFLAGALYAFSPLVLFQSAGAHLMATSLIVPPLVLACIDELFWRRRRTPWKVGVALAALLVVQFFSGTEVLTMLAVTTALGLGGIGVLALVTDRDRAIVAIRAGAPGLAIGIGLAVVLLAWPAWYALLGPGHFAGPVWPDLAPAQASLRSYLVGVPGTLLWWAPHSGRFVRPTYLGPPLIGTVVVGLVAFGDLPRRAQRVAQLVTRHMQRTHAAVVARDEAPPFRGGRLWAASALTLLVAWLALGQRYLFAPWHYLVHAPVLHDVMNERFAALLFLPAGLALALVLDALLTWRRGAVGIAAALLVGVACATPFALDAANGLPYAASSVWQPLWYQRQADALPPNQVVLGFPFFNTSADLLGVQALHAMHYAVVGGTGPEWIDSRQGSEEPGYEVIQQVASSALAPLLAATATPTQRAAVLDALQGWGVTLVVVPMQRGPNTSAAARSPQRIETWLVSVLGRPDVVDDAWVWRRSP